MFTKAQNGAVDAAPPAPPPVWPPVVKLSKAIDTHGGKVTEIKFAEMTAGIMMRHRKSPFEWVFEGEGDQAKRSQRTDFELAGRYICDLCGIDEVVLSQMAYPDFVECVAALHTMLFGLKN